MILLLPMLFGCIEDDWNGQPYTGYDGAGTSGTDTGSSPGAAGITGEWVSEGADLATLLADEPFNYLRVDASFGASGIYEVVGEDADGTLWPLIGTWSVTEGTPGAIALDQTEPYAATAAGIWQVDGDVLTYEVVQTSPDYGFQAPTTGSGFGSSTGPGLTPGVNVQTYRWIP